MQASYDSQKYVSQGKSLFRQGKQAQAVIKFKKAILLNPTNGLPYFEWAYSLPYQVENSFEISLYRKALHFNSDDCYIHYNLAVALSQQGFHEEAIQKLEDAIKYGYSYNAAQNNWGYGLYCLGRYDEAIQKFQNAIKYLYNDVKAYINWGLVLFHQNKIYKAKEAFIVGTEKIVHDQGRVKEIICIYSTQIDITKKCLENSTDEASKLYFKTKQQALEMTISILRLNDAEIYRCLAPSKDMREQEPEQIQEEDLLRKLPKKYGNFVSKKLEGILKKVLSVVGIQVYTDEPITSETVSFALKQLSLFPAIFNSFDTLHFIMSDQHGEMDSVDNQIKTREKNHKFQTFLDYFISLDEIIYVIEQLTPKLVKFRADELLIKPDEEFDILTQEQIQEASVFFEIYNVEEITDKYSIRDLEILIVICLLEGVKAKEFASIDEKVTNIAEAIFEKFKQCATA